MCLLEPMRTAQKVWTMSVFASANAIRKYKMQELVELGLSRLWMGLESPQASYSKLKGTHANSPANFASTVFAYRERRSSGSSITPRITSLARLNTPSPTTPTSTSSSSTRRSRERPCISRCLKKAVCCPTSTMLMFTGQFKFNFKHAAISRDDSKRFLDGPSGAIIKPMAPACTASHARCWPDGGATKIGPMRECASVSRTRCIA